MQADWLGAPLLDPDECSCPTEDLQRNVARFTGTVTYHCPHCDTYHLLDADDIEMEDLA